MRAITVNYKKMNNQTLFNSAKGAVKQEKRLTAIVLEHLQEIERRRAYCDLGISSLFKYCVMVLGYSEAEASYRVNATRLVAISPMAKKGIGDGTLSLTAASKLHGHLKQEQKGGADKKNAPNKSDRKKITPCKVEQLVKAACGKSTRQLEMMLKEESSTKMAPTKRVELNERMLKKIEKLRALYGDGDTGGDSSDLEILEIALDNSLAQAQQQRPKRRSNHKSQNPRYIDRAAKESIRARSGGQCEYISPVNGQRCRARLHLQIDHIRPLSLGGGSGPENLRHFCFAHNQHAAISLLGQKKMDQFVGGDHVELEHR